MEENQLLCVRALALGSHKEFHYPAKNRTILNKMLEVKEMEIDSCAVFLEHGFCSALGAETTVLGYSLHYHINMLSKGAQMKDSVMLRFWHP